MLGWFWKDAPVTVHPLWLSFSCFLKKWEIKIFGIYSANIIKECPVGQNLQLGVAKSYKSIQIFIFFAIEICMICEDLKDFFASKASKLDNSPQATQKDDSLNSY